MEAHVVVVAVGQGAGLVKPIQPSFVYVEHIVDGKPDSQIVQRQPREA
jgi:hypothetical protein